MHSKNACTGNKKHTKMRNIVIALILFLTASCSFLFYKLKSITNDRDRLKSNQEVIYGENQRYKVKDSINVLSVKELKLKLNEVKKFRSNDYDLIKKLNVQASQLTQIIKTNTITIAKLKSALKDSIIDDPVHEFKKDTIKCFTYKSTYIDVQGCIINDSLDINIQSRDSLMYIEHIVKKRFAFIRLPIWLFGYKSKNQEILSRNPNTAILDAEYITVYK